MDDQPDTWQRLDRRTITVERIEGAIFAAVVSTVVIVGTAAGTLSTRLPFWIDVSLLSGALAFALLLGWHFYRWPPIAYARAAYRIDDDGIEIREGVVWRSIVNVPRSRVQHTDVSQGPLERRYDLGTVVIHTAGNENAEVRLSGVAHETAIAIRDRLLPQRRADVV
jgi:membrane protein YdbS with pleckstrin-like domain